MNIKMLKAIYCNRCGKLINHFGLCRKCDIKKRWFESYSYYKKELKKFYCIYCGKRVGKYKRKCRICWDILRTNPKNKIKKIEKSLGKEKFSGHCMICKAKISLRALMCRSCACRKYSEYHAIIIGTIISWSKWRIFREKILKRDNYRCRICNKEANEIHHKKSKELFPELCWHKNNVISICSKCHGLETSKK